MNTADMIEHGGHAAAVYQNTCSCLIYDTDTEKLTVADECDGACWEDAVENFANITKHLFSDHNQGFRIAGFPVWNGTVNGYFLARNASELLNAITPDRTEWRLEVTVHADHLTGRLYHHDAPTGGTITVTPFSEDAEEVGA